MRTTNADDPPSSPLGEGGSEGDDLRRDNVYSTIKDRTLAAGPPDKSDVRTLAPPPPGDPNELVLVRSFVYGLDYIDEVVAHIMPAPAAGETNPARRWVLQDANYNVVGIARECDNQLIRQFRYGAYGDFERQDLTGDITGIEGFDSAGQPVSLTPADSASPQAFEGLWYDVETGLIYARGRYLEYRIGRFLSADPNGQGLVLDSSVRHGGQPPFIGATLSVGSDYGDGSNRYEFVRGNPITGNDPTGLYYDAWDEIDDIAAHYYADRVAAQVETIEQAKYLARRAQAVAMGMAQRMAIESVAAAMWAPAPYAFAAYDTFTAFYEMYEHGVSWGSAFGLAANIYAAKFALDVGPSLGIKLRKGQKRSAGLGLDIDSQTFRSHLADADVRYRGNYLGGSFSIRDWTGYPGGIPKPKGPFRMLEGAEYDHARRAANNANRRLHDQHPEWKDMEIHEIHPVKYGGSPTDPANKVALPPSEHVQYTTYWGSLQAKLRNGASP